MDPVLTERVVAYLLEESEKVTDLTYKTLPFSHVKDSLTRFELKKGLFQLFRLT